ncbi:MAG TPA: hypothetical protein PKU97_01375 [Kofleriaceae bacterium]|nr:hypothetical protein [Kofleriaceae bacterium]
MSAPHGRPLAVPALLAVATALLPGDAPAQERTALPILARADELAREISALRGLPLRRPIAKEAVDKAELTRRLTALLAKETEALDREERLLKHWGLVPAHLVYRDLVTRTLSEQIAGYYDHETRRLTLTLDEQLVADDELAEGVLTHEIQHALQDQSFDLAKLSEVAPDEDDESAAREALIEGDGVAVMMALQAARLGDQGAWHDPTTAAELAADMLGETGDDFDDLPLAIRERLIFPYAAGLMFVAFLRQTRSWRAVDAAFRKLPVSTEQILHPARYLRGERPLRVPRLTAPSALPAASLRAETVWGELGFSIFLRTHGVDPVQAAAAAAGWGGDRVSVLELRRGEELGIARLRWDSDEDAAEAYEALVHAVDRWLLGPIVEQSAERTAWLGISGRLSFIERRGAALLLVHAAPLAAAARLSAELWRATPHEHAPPAQDR